MQSIPYEGNPVGFTIDSGGGKKTPTFNDQTLTFSNNEGAITKSLSFDSKGEEYAFTITSGTLPLGVTFDTSGAFVYDGRAIDQDRDFYLILEISGSNLKSKSATVTIEMVGTYVDQHNYLYFMNPAGSTKQKKIALIKKGNPTNPNVLLEYSLDKINWSSYTVGNYITLANAGDKVWFKGDNESFSADYGTTTNCYIFDLSGGQIECHGNVMSLIDSSCESTNLSANFSGLFNNNTNLITSPELPATTLSNYCYYSMFLNCTSLSAAPELPATTLPNYCYYRMFEGCTSLSAAPELPATTVGQRSYGDMFNGCTSLSAAPELIATTLGNYCYNNMFKNCTSLLSGPSVLPTSALTRGCYQSMFNGCSSLIEAPELLATTLFVDCYSYMFYGCSSLLESPDIHASILDSNCCGNMFDSCTSLRVAPELSATTLDNNCYNQMFQNCISLSSAPPVLPATTLSSYCYYGMFHNCSSLIEAPELPATTLASYCYSNMFDGCTNLTEAPELPATTLASYCYSNMFQLCTNLSAAPKLPATTLSFRCYYNMFWLCTSLSAAPELPATTLTLGCYTAMFADCTHLSEVSANFTSWSQDSTSFWLTNVSPTGTFTCPPDLPVERGDTFIPTNWVVYSSVPVMDDQSFSFYSLVEQTENLVYRLPKGQTATFAITSGTLPLGVTFDTSGAFVYDGTTALPDEIKEVEVTLSMNGTPATSAIITLNLYSQADQTNYLYFMNPLNSNSSRTVQLKKTGSPVNGSLSLQYSTDKTNWSTYTVGSTITLSNAGDKVYFRGTNNTFTTQNDTDKQNYYGFVLGGGGIECHGEVRSLYDETCTLSTVPCLRCLFSGQTNLLTSPELPAAKLSNDCYNRMFDGCTSLTTPPVLSAVSPNFAQECYRSMFRGCTSLSSTPDLPSLLTTKNCYKSMFNTCTSLTTTANMAATSLAETSCAWMYEGCTSLVSAFLPCNTFTGKQTYQEMFKSCTALTYMEVGFDAWDKSSGMTSGWVTGVGSTGTFVKPSSLTESYGANRIPSGWTIVNK